jgi:hypothetical protein
MITDDCAFGFPRSVSSDSRRDDNDDTLWSVDEFPVVAIGETVFVLDGRPKNAEKREKVVGEERPVTVFAAGARLSFVACGIAVISPFAVVTPMSFSVADNLSRSIRSSSSSSYIPSFLPCESLLGMKGGRSCGHGGDRNASVAGLLGSDSSGLDGGSGLAFSDPLKDLQSKEKPRGSFKYLVNSGTVNEEHITHPPLMVCVCFFRFLLPLLLLGNYT